MLTAFLVMCSFFRSECSGYWHVPCGRQFFPMSCLCFSHIHSRSSCSEARSCGQLDLLRINSCSCTNPICWLRCHSFNWSSMCLLHSESFVNLNVVSLQNDHRQISSRHLFSIIGVFLRLSLEILSCCDERVLLDVTFSSGPLRNQH